MAYFLVCPDSGTLSVDAGERPRCRDASGLNAWEYHHTDELNPIVDLTPLENLNNLLDILFTFDPELFGIVLFGCVMLFSTGWGAGVVARLLGKNS